MQLLFSFTGLIRPPSLTYSKNFVVVVFIFCCQRWLKFVLAKFNTIKLLKLIHALPEHRKLDIKTSNYITETQLLKP